jgi:hypothetical protein
VFATSTLLVIVCVYICVVVVVSIEVTVSEMTVEEDPKRALELRQEELALAGWRCRYQSCFDIRQHSIPV